MNVAISFMFKPGHTLESEGILLAASIRHFVSVPVNIYAFIESKDRADVTDQHRSIFSKLGVTLREIDATGVWKTRYPHGNKILVCAAQYDEERVIFLDSDTIFIQKTDLAPITCAPLVLAPSMGTKWRGDHNWNAAYAMFGVSEADIPSMLNPKGVKVPAYFNAGMVSFDRNSGFGDIWLKTALAIDENPDIQGKRPFLDQISLPVLAFSGGPSPRLPDRKGFNVRPRGGLLKDIVLAHYTQSYLYFSGAYRIAEHVLQQQLGTDLRALERQRIRNSIATIRKRITPGKKPVVKIWGERNSGTTAMKNLIEANFDCEVIPYIGFNTTMARDALNLPKGTMSPSPFDLLDQVAAPSHLGWHAGAPPLDMVLESVYLPDTLFLCMTRDPFSWLHSVWRAGQNPLKLTAAKHSLFQFLSSPWPVTARDRVQTPFEATPIEVYQAKLKAYLDFKRICPSPTRIVPFERIQNADPGLLEALARDLEPGNDSVGYPAPSIPVGNVDQDQTPPKTTHELLGFTEEETKYVKDRLDPDLFARLEQESFG